MSTPSKFAKEVTGELFTPAHPLRTTVEIIDQALTPVRECLEGLRRGPCWCRHVGHIHTADCLAAQQLYERLKQS